MAKPVLGNVDERTARILRLPVWAQKEIQHLTWRAEQAERELAESRREIALGDTDTMVYPYDDDPLTLRPHADVAFRLGQTWRGDSVRARIMRDGRLNLNGDGQLVILPRSSNDVDVILGSR